MDLNKIVSNTPGFNDWPHTARIKFLGWFFHSIQLKSRFTIGDIRVSYEMLHLAKPGNLSQLLSNLIEQKNILKDGSGLYLERRLLASLESRHGQRPATVQTGKLLIELPIRVPELAERDFLNEAILCFQAGAYRAAIVMAWNLSFDHLCSFVLKSQLAAFNAQWPKSFEKDHQRARVQVICKREDFSELKESQVIQICRSAAIITGDIYKILSEKLDKRNSAAHPSGIEIGALQAESFIDDLIKNVVLKLI